MTLPKANWIVIIAVLMEIKVAEKALLYSLSNA
jgi:hypothetical protein